MGKFTPGAITLCIYDKNATEFGVTWQTDEAGSPVLEYTHEDDRDFAHAVRVAGEVSEGTESMKNCAVIRGLKPGERCRYRVGDESGDWSEAAVFAAPSHDPEKLTFLIMTDTQDQDNYGVWLRSAWEDAAARFPEAEILCHTGDIVQEGGSAMMWRKMLGYNEAFFRTIPMSPTAGNHDYWYGYLHNYDSVQMRHYCIDLPEQDTAHGMYYSFDCGPVHFTVLSSGDSMETDGHGLLPEQLEWAKADIAGTDKRWKIVSVHNPLYSPGKYGSRDPLFGVALSLREQLNGFFAEAGVDLVLCGHDHVYSRTYPIGTDGLPIVDYACEDAVMDGVPGKIAIDPAGPIHLESGCGGNQNRRIEPDIKPEFACAFEEMSDMTERAVGYSAVVIDGDSMTVEYRENSVDNGKCVKRHWFGIRKTR